MKNLFPYLLATLFISAGSIPNAWAGVNYSQYHDNYKAEKSAAEPRGEKSLEHTSKYQREMPAGQNTLPTLQRDLNRPTPRSDVTK